MAYIGKVPTPVPLTSSDVTDGIISNAKLAQDIISADTALGAEPADTDEFLVSDAGVLKRMDYSHIKGGAAHTLISTTTISSDASVTISSGIDSTYKVYMFELINLHPNNDNVHLHMQFLQGGSLDTGGVYDSATGEALSGGGAMAFQTETNSTYMRLAENWSSDNSSGLNGRIFLYNPSDTTYDTHMMFDVVFQEAGSVTQRNAGTGRIEETAAVDGLKFFMSAAEIDAGIIKLYGVT